LFTRINVFAVPTQGPVSDLWSGAKGWQDVQISDGLPTILQWLDAKEGGGDNPFRKIEQVAQFSTKK
jgi:hypothetical protein